MTPRSTQRTMTFTAEERKRIAAACTALGVSFEEFGRISLLHAVDEVEALGRELQTGHHRPPQSPWWPRGGIPASPHVDDAALASRHDHTASGTDPA